MNRCLLIALPVGIALFLVSATTLIAQPVATPLKNRLSAPWVKGLPQSAQPQVRTADLGARTYKVAGTSSRIIASASRPPDGAGSYVFQPSDSAYFVYSGNRGGDGSVENPSNYDTLVRWQWDDAVQAILPVSRSIRTYNPKDLVLNGYEQQFISGNWEEGYKESITYNLADKDSVFSQYYWDTATSTWRVYNRTVSLYNSAGWLDNTIQEDLDGTTNTLVPRSRNRYMYNAVGLVSLAEYASWDPVLASWKTGSRDIFSYTSANLISRYTNMSGNFGGSLDTFMTGRYYYNSADQLVGTTHYNHELNEADSAGNFPRSSTGLPLISTYYVFDGSGWLPENRVVYTYTSTDKLSSETQQTYTFGTWPDYRRETLVYDTFNQLIRSFAETFYSGTWMPHYSGDFDHRYYYVAYGTAVIPPGNTNKPQITLSPIPADGFIQLCIVFTQLSNGSVAIRDMNGRMISEWNLTGVNSTSERIDTRNFSAGMYAITVNHPTGVSTRTFTIRR